MCIFVFGCVVHLSLLFNSIFVIPYFHLSPFHISFLFLEKLNFSMNSRVRLLVGTLLVGWSVGPSLVVKGRERTFLGIQFFFLGTKKQIRYDMTESCVSSSVYPLVLLGTARRGKGFLVLDGVANSPPSSDLLSLNKVIGVSFSFDPSYHILLIPHIL